MNRKIIRVLTYDRIARNVSAILADDFDIEEIDHPDDLNKQGSCAATFLSAEYLEGIPSAFGDTEPLVIVLSECQSNLFDLYRKKPLVHFVDADSRTEVLLQSVQSVQRLKASQEMISDLSRGMVFLQSEIDVFSHIGSALGSEREPDRLLDLILSYARQITDADSGSIYISREKKGDDGSNTKVLVFSKTQSDTLDLPFQNAELPISEDSIAGSVALKKQSINIDDVYDLPLESPFRFNPDFDRSVNYCTKSMLTVPLCNHENEVIGVLQLINKKRNSREPLFPIEAVETEVIPFTRKDEERALAFGGIAAVALENSILYAEIERLFEGFVRAAVKSIEARDPVTYGHSERVTQLTLALAQAVDRTKEGLYADVSFSEEQMRELRFAGLLHDIGKIGVREEVLNKTEKLLPGEWAVLKQRIGTIRNCICLNDREKRIEFLLHHSVEEYHEQCGEWDRRLNERLKELERIQEVLEELNQPGFLSDSGREQLMEIANRFYQSEGVRKVPYLTEREVECFSIPKGNLTVTELEEIRSHIVHTRNFLEMIPWSSNLLGLTEIACGHHEMLDGSGYPKNLQYAEISLQARMMAIADIFDALTATDRPYKKALPRERAFEILDAEVKEGRLDGELVRIFKEEKIYKAVQQE